MKVNLETYVEKHFFKLSSREKYLIQNVNIESKAFFLACYFEQNVNIIKSIIHENVVNVHKTDLNNNNGLIYACEKNKIHVIKYLVDDLHLNIHVVNKFTNNCFMYACSSNHDIEVIKYFIEQLNYDMNIIDKYGFSALLYALLNAEKKISTYLIEIVRVKMDIESVNTNKLYIPYHKYAHYISLYHMNSKVRKKLLLLFKIILINII